MLCLLSPESAVPKDHPIRRIKALADEVLRELSPKFDAMYGTHWASVDPAGAFARGDDLDGALQREERAALPSERVRSKCSPSRSNAIDRSRLPATRATTAARSSQDAER
jgi:hypothetical protein